jgi:hypothetical protein
VVAAAHAALRWATRLEPPAVRVPPFDPSRTWTRFEHGLREVHLEGSAEAIGAGDARLLRDVMISDEAALWAEYERYVPWWIVRTGIDDWSRLRYRHVDRALPEARRRELAAQALAFQPDPFASRLPTYQRMVFLHAVYDIALSLEHSPLIGCTSFALAPEATWNGHVLFARAFDFEAGEMFDHDKVVFLVREDGAIPFASVAWPGFIGVVTGVNAEGVALVVHGGRAGTPSVDGIPVAFSLRDTLERAHDTEEAVSILSSQPVMVSHITFVADAAGRFAAVERAPGATAYVRATERSTAVTNHFEGPLASDPKNLAVRATTSTLARRARVDELLAGVAPRSATPETALAILRDHRCADDAACSPGDRRAIDALIATHGVVADLTDRVLWVSAGPHLTGEFVRLDLRSLLAAGHGSSDDGAVETMPADPALSHGAHGAARPTGGSL